MFEKKTEIDHIHHAHFVATYGFDLTSIFGHSMGKSEF